MGFRTNYVIAAWTGPRRADPRAGFAYLDFHLDQLSKTPHDLSQITVVLPYSENITKKDRIRLEARRRIGKSNLVFMFKENRGISYGSWNHAYMQYRDSFDYYFFIEDDYVYTKNNFDTVLINIFNSSANCGYLCTYAKDYPAHHHAAISNGIASSTVLEKVVKQQGWLPHYAGHEMKYSATGQLDFSRAFLEAGFSIADTTNVFRAPYFEPLNSTIVEFAPQQREYIIQPVQMLPGWK